MKTVLLSPFTVTCIPSDILSLPAISIILLFPWVVMAVLVSVSVNELIKKGYYNLPAAVLKYQKFFILV